MNKKGDIDTFVGLVTVAIIIIVAMIVMYLAFNVYFGIG